MIDPNEVHVIVPDPMMGASVMSVADLLDQLEGADTLEAATMNAAFDSSTNDKGVELLVVRVRDLNATGDVNAYWAPRD